MKVGLAKYYAMRKCPKSDQRKIRDLKLDWESFDMVYQKSIFEIFQMVTHWLSEVGHSLELYAGRPPSKFIKGLITRIKNTI